MTLFLTALDEEAEQHEFSCRMALLEDIFDFLSHIVVEGHTLLSACIIDGPSRMNLPLAAFDGLPLSVGIQALEKEWQDILSQPRRADTLYRQERIQLTRQQIHFYEVNIAAHERMIDYVNRWLQYTQERVGVATGRSQLIGRYEAQLVMRQAQLAKARFYSTLATNRLSQLSDG